MLPVGYVTGRFVEPDSTTPARGTVRFDLVAATAPVSATAPALVAPRRVAAELVDGRLAPLTADAPLELALVAPIVTAPAVKLVVTEQTRIDAELARNAAQAAATAAANARKDAQAHMASAWNARNEAATARTGAESAATSAVGSRAAAESAATAAGTARTAADAARDAARTARDETVAARDDAQAAAELAVTARNIAQAAADLVPWIGTRTEYDALAARNPDRLYLIRGI